MTNRTMDYLMDALSSKPEHQQTIMRHLIPTSQEGSHHCVVACQRCQLSGGFPAVQSRAIHSCFDYVRGLQCDGVAVASSDCMPSRSREGNCILLLGCGCGSGNYKLMFDVIDQAIILPYYR